MKFIIAIATRIRAPWFARVREHPRTLLALLLASNLKIPTHGSLVDAAYSPKRMSANAIRVEAARLLTHPAIALAIQLSRTKTAEKHEITKDFLVGRLLGIATKAEESERTYSSAVAALMGVAKITGHITDKHEHAGRNGGPIETITTTMTAQEAADAYARMLEGEK